MNKSIMVLILVVAFLNFPAPVSYAQELPHPATEIDWIGDMIFSNECSGKVKDLVAWNEGEDFPSLGIGHFIWFPESYTGPFEESFPELMVFLKSKGIPLPEDLNWLNSRHAPWKNRQEFISVYSSAQIMHLRDYLIQTKSFQTEFLAARFAKSLPMILAAVPAGSRREIRKKIMLILETKGGLYPLIDYVNFKGDGVSETARYRGQGWGLLQVLEEMNISETRSDTIAEFVRAAETILDRRVKKSPRGRREKRWLAGWKARVHTYLSAMQSDHVSASVANSSQAMDQTKLSDIDDILPATTVPR